MCVTYVYSMASLTYWSPEKIRASACSSSETAESNAPWGSAHSSIRNSWKGILILMCIYIILYIYIILMLFYVISVVYIITSVVA